MRYVEVCVGGGAVFFGLKASLPFVKWVGGKRKLYKQILEKLNVSHGYDSFYIADLNYDLITTYRCLQNDVENVIDILCSWPQTEVEYYRLRAYEPDTTETNLRAARMLYLNLHCFNGLWRVNASGKMNAPYGGKAPTRPEIRTYDMAQYSKRLREAALCLQNVHINHADFSTTLSQCGIGDDVYIDPPYLPDDTSKYTSYTKRITESQLQLHRRLANEIVRAVQRGASVVISNSPAAQELYNVVFSDVNHTVDLIKSNRSIGLGKGSGVARRQEEILVTVTRG